MTLLKWKLSRYQSRLPLPIILFVTHFIFRIPFAIFLGSTVNKHPEGHEECLLSVAAVSKSNIHGDPL